MNSKNKIIRTISLIGVCALAVTTARAVVPPPDGGYANGNTAEGEDALFNLTTGFGNTAIGFNALYNNTTSSFNTATGYYALISNTTGSSNTATGFDALESNTTGASNTATGFYALLNNSTGNTNTATGDLALAHNTTGSGNTATGGNALVNNTSGNTNTATGSLALFGNTIGKYNTATGYYALGHNTIGISNTAIGHQALLNNMGSNNIAFGNKAGLNLDKGDNNIDIGNAGVALDRDTIRIGDPAVQSNTFIAGINGVTVSEGIEVIIDTDGHLGTVVSSARYKEGIKPMDEASEAILALEPVTFRYKHERDPKGIPQFGLVAEQVAKVDPDLVARDDQGKPYTVRYAAVNAMLLNEFLKEHRKVAEQSEQITELKATVAELKSALKTQATQIQKVSDQLSTKAPDFRAVANN